MFELRGSIKQRNEFITDTFYDGRVQVFFETLLRVEFAIDDVSLRCVRNVIPCKICPSHNPKIVLTTCRAYSLHQMRERISPSIPFKNIGRCNEKGQAKYELNNTNKP